MTAILRVPGVMFQQRVVPACSAETDSATINFCQPAQEDRRRPPSVISGAISGAGSALGGGCTGFTVGDPPVDGDNDTPDAEGGDDAVEPEDVTELVDVDGDGEPDYEVAEDGEIPEVHDDGEIFDFEDGEVEEDGETTDPCVNSPVFSATTSPVDGAPDIPLTPTLDWDAGDLDAGDTLTYRVRVWRTADPSTILVDETVGDSQYAVPAGILANNENYSWQVDAWDSCSPTPNLISSPIWTFTTELACAPYSFTDTDFITGTLGGGAVANAGSLRLQEDYSAYTGRYEGDVLPTAVGWTRNGSFVSEGVSGGILSINTLGTDLTGYYELSTSFDNAVGEVIEWRMALDAQDDPTPLANTPFQVRVADGRRLLRINIFTDRVCDLSTSSTYMLDATVYHTYRLVAQGDDVLLYVDGALAIDGTGLSGTGAGGSNYIRFGDQLTIPDGSARIDYLYYYSAGIRLPYLSSGSYESVPIDTAVPGYEHSGDTIGWVPTTGAGEVSIAVRTGDSADLTSVPWSAEMTDNPAILPTVTGQYLQWRATLNAVPATSTPVVDEVNGGRICP